MVAKPNGNKLNKTIATNKVNNLINGWLMLTFCIDVVFIRDPERQEHKSWI